MSVHNSVQQGVWASWQYVPYTEPTEHKVTMLEHLQAPLTAWL